MRVVITHLVALLSGSIIGILLCVRCINLPSKLPATPQKSTKTVTTKLDPATGRVIETTSTIITKQAVKKAKSPYSLGISTVVPFDGTRPHEFMTDVAARLGNLPLSLSLGVSFDINNLQQFSVLGGIRYEFGD